MVIRIAFGKNILTNIMEFVLAVIADVLPLPLILKYISSGRIQWLIYALICYMVLIFAYTRLLRRVISLDALYTILKIYSILLLLFIGIVFLGEKLDAKKIIGLVFGMLAIYLLV